MIRPNDLKDDELWSLFQACCDGDLDRVRTLVSKRPELVHRQYNYTPPIHFAVREGHADIVQWLLEKGFDPAAYRTYPFQETLLTIAQDRGYREIEKLLREVLTQRFPALADINEFLEAARNGDFNRIQAELGQNPAMARAVNESGDTALHQAAAGGHLRIVHALLDAGADPDAVRADGARPIHCALDRQSGKSEQLAGVLAGVLLARGAAYNVYLAAELGDLAFLRDALARDPSLANFADSSHRRPISAAARRQDLEMVKLLLASGADPSLPEEGAPLGLALWFAVFHKQYEMAKLLLEHGANPNTAPESSGSVLLLAENDPALKQLLLDYGADERTVDLDRFERLVSDSAYGEVERLLRENPELARDESSFWGEGILSVPANQGNREMIELLVRYGARVPDVSKWGRYYYFKHTEIAALLLELGMNPNHCNWHRVTLLHDMAHEGDIPKARLLLDYGADIDAVDEEYRSTPLGYAARWGHREMVSFLLARGADPNKAGAPWATPLAWARQKGDSDIEADLRKAGAR